MIIVVKKGVTSNGDVQQYENKVQKFGAVYSMPVVCICDRMFIHEMLDADLSIAC